MKDAKTTPNVAAYISTPIESSLFADITVKMKISMRGSLRKVRSEINDALIIRLAIFVFSRSFAWILISRSFKRNKRSSAK